MSSREARADNPHCGSVPTLYRKKNLKKRAVLLSQDRIDLEAQNFNDKASSIMVPEGWTVTLYEDRNFEGASLALRGFRGGKAGCVTENFVRPNFRIRDHRNGRNSLRSWDHVVSSVSVRRDEKPLQPNR